MPWLFSVGGNTRLVCLLAVFAWGVAELLLETCGEMRQGVEACHVGDFRNVVLALCDEGSRPVQFESLEEDARVLACQSLYLVVQFGA